MFENVLFEKKEKIIGKWLQLIADAHPAGSRLLVDKDQFTNPVGYVLSSQTPILYDAFLEDQLDSEEAFVALSNIVQSRAVQDFSPSEAISFVFLLKEVIRDELKSQLKDKQAYKELRAIEDRVDKMVGLAFNAYVNAREKVNEIRIKEVKRDRENAFRMLDRMIKKRAKLADSMVNSYNGSEVM